MVNWKSILIPENKTVFEAIKVIDSTFARVALVVDANMRLVGTITDGDVRRGILRGVSLESNVSNVLNKKPIVSDLGKEKGDYELELKKHEILQLPLINKEKMVAGLYVASELYLENEKPNRVVLMAGGLGARLGDLTIDCPKPMLKVGGKPILEAIIANFKKEGFRNFYLAVNYKSEIIEDHFGDGKDFGVHIEYLREDRRLGTAGSLSLIEKELSEPIVVMNGDLVTSISISEMIKFHNETNAKATTCIREYGYQMQFGVVETDGTDLVKITEKPMQKCFVNAGIYVIDPSVLKRIPKGESLDMPVLLNSLVSDCERVSVFPVREYWLDIGRREDFERAHLEYGENFE